MVQRLRPSSIMAITATHRTIRLPSPLRIEPVTAESRLFGTDGVRGLANRYPMTPEMALLWGALAAEYLQATRVSARGRSSSDVIHDSPGTCWRRPSALGFVRPGSMLLG